MLAEEQTCHSTWFITLTYGGGYENADAYWLNYQHVQLMFKKLRKAGHRFKYVAVGEHGEKRNRAHFHILMFWQNEPPKCEMNKPVAWDFWDHGNVQAEYPRSQQGCAVYLMDYMNKENLEKSVMKYSKNPMLGTEYLLQYAREHAKNGLSLFAQSDRFTIPDNNSQSGKPFYYPVGRETSLYEKMIMEYLNEWAVQRPDQPLPLNEELSEYLSDLVQDTSELKKPLQVYIEKIYGYAPQEVLPVITKETTYALEGMNLIVNDAIVRVQVFNREGKISWQDVVALTPNGDASLKGKQLAEMVELAISLAPPRCATLLRPLREHLKQRPKEEAYPLGEPP